jgi:peptidoglycan-associated lipoprotein
MRKSLYLLAVIALLLVGIAVTGTGCKTKVQPPPATKAPAPTGEQVAPTSPAPTISLTALPAAINRGQVSTLSWRTTNASEVVIDGGVGTVEASGNRTVSPSTSTTFTARATGPGGTATAEARVTVSEVSGVIPPIETPVSAVDLFPKVIKDAFYDYDSYELREEARQALIEDARALSGDVLRMVRITIEGHCDERGSEAYNLALGDKRANAARDFLIAQGIDPARIDTISFGEEKPFATGHDEESWRQNRRAHFVMR